LYIDKNVAYTSPILQEATEGQICSASY